MSDKQLTAAEYAAEHTRRQLLLEEHKKQMGPTVRRPEFRTDLGDPVTDVAESGRLRFYPADLTRRRLPALLMWIAKTYPAEFAEFLEAWHAGADEDQACACGCGAVRFECGMFIPGHRVSCRTCDHPHPGHENVGATP